MKLPNLSRLVPSWGAAELVAALVQGLARGCICR